MDKPVDNYLKPVDNPVDNFTNPGISDILFMFRFVFFDIRFMVVNEYTPQSILLT